MTMLSTTDLRAKFALRLSTLYAQEVPAYTTLVDVSREVNDRVLGRDAAAAQRLGSIGRVTAERHGAIRVGTPRELRQVARIFAALGMHAAGFYDLRDAHPQPVPVVSTAFRPLERVELAHNPFRVFTSMLVPQDRRFFDSDLSERLTSFLDSRQLFPDRLLELADRGERERGLNEADAEEFLNLAAAAFALSPDPIDYAWYRELERVSGVAADIGGVRSTHINHLTPRVLDIDDLYRSMSARGVQMIDEIQGPPRWDGPDVLLRQTSFRALEEPRSFRHPDGSVNQGSLRVRFGEVEARGVALTPSGRDRYEQLVAETDRRVSDDREAHRADLAREVWQAGFPNTEADLAQTSLAYFTFSVAPRRADGQQPPGSLRELLAAGWLRADPIVYEDFLPRSAAGIFASNLTDRGESDSSQGGADRSQQWLSEAIGRPITSPEWVYARERADSLTGCALQLGLNPAGLLAELEPAPA